MTNDFIGKVVRKMKEKTISTKLKGTVLYTVVSVLMVLIVFLMGTLALAATANNRAMNNYNSAQTQTTAKAAVEAVMSAMQNNASVATAAAGVDESHPLLTLEGITFEDGSLGTVDFATIEYAGKKWIYEDDTESDDYGKMVEKTVVKISATVSQGKESSTVSVYVLKDSSPAVPNDGNNNGFVSTGSASTDNHVSAFGGTYLGFDAAYADPNNILLSDIDFKFVNGEAIETDMQINGNFYVNNGSMTLVIKEPGSGLTVWGNMGLNKEFYVRSVNATTATFTSSDARSYREIPYIYVENNLAVNFDNGGIGSSDIPLNIFCGDIDINGNGSKTIYADIYCYDPTAVSEFTPGGGNSLLYKWVATVVDPSGSEKEVSAGNFYSKGSLKIGSNGATFDGNVVVGGDVTIDATTTIKGNLTVGGTLYANNKLTVNGTIYCDDIRDYGGTNTAGLVPDVDTTKTIKGHYEVKPGYTYEVKQAVYSKTLTIVHDGWTEYNAWGWAKEDGTVIERIYQDLVGVLQPDDTMLYYQSWDTGYTNPIEPPTYEVYKNSAGDEVEAEEAGTWVDTQYFNAAGDLLASPVIIPKEYEKDVILGKEVLAGHDSTDDSKIITTVNDVLTSSTNPYNTLHEIPSTYLADVEANDFTLGGSVTEVAGVIKQDGSKYIITGSCTIGGNLNQQTVEFKVPTGQEIWVKVKGMNCANNCQFIQDDSDPNYRGTVNLLLTGDLKFTGNNNPSITTTTVQSLLSAGDAFQIYTNSAYAVADVPTIHGVNLNIYADTNAHELYFQNSTTITANIKAPYLTITIASGGGRAPSNSHIYYNGFDVLSDANSKNLGCIGCCIIKEFYSQNNWTLLYVGRSGGGGNDGFEDAIMKNWKILYYENY